MSILFADKNNFQQIRSSDKTVLIDFYADWCGPCRALAPVVEEIARENPHFLVAKVNVDEEPEIASEYRISSVPTLVVIKNGSVAGQSVGAKSKTEILQMLKDE